jgi:hypothetical protein
MRRRTSSTTSIGARGRFQLSLRFIHGVTFDKRFLFEPGRFIKRIKFSEILDIFHAVSS